jgi:amino acid adenylation domain-containing protein
MMKNQDMTNTLLHESNTDSDTNNLINKKRKVKYKLFDTLHHNYRPYPKNKTLYEVFQERVEETPDKIAISFSKKTLTYRELNEKANQLARLIRSRYYTHNNKILLPDTLVAIYVSRSLDMIVSILGVLKSGAAYVPIDINSPDQRISYILNDTKCNLVITESCFVNKIDQYSETLHNNQVTYTHISMILMDEMHYLHEINTDLKPQNKANDLAYVIYTSGTTGRPKGVMIEHHSVVNLCSSRREDYGIDSSSVVLQYSPIAFDCSVCEIFSALLNGAKLSIIDDITKKDSSLLIEFILSEKISVATFLPSLLSQLALTKLPRFPHLKTIIAAGEACTSDVISKWNQVCNLIIGYGPTETTVCSTLSPYKNNDAPNIIGTAIPNTCIYLLNENFEQVEIGEIGEICVSGVSLARGYLNKPEATTQKFIDNPFVTQLDKDNGYSMLYRTGDLARWHEDDRLEYIGRNDSQVKIRGHRIGLEEIQMELSTYPGIMQVYVQARERNIVNNSSETDIQNSSSMKYLVVYYLSNTTISTECFVNHLSRNLPEYMIPSYFIKLDFFPQTQNGKIDSNALPEPKVDIYKNDYVHPSTELENQICQIWGSILGLDHVGIHSNFFYIGGDSLLVISLIAFINSKFSVKITTAMINDNPTVSTQAKLIQKQLDSQLTCSSDKNLNLIRTFRSHGKYSPLIFIHPSLTDSAIYSDMVEWLDQDQPFYGIESYNLSHLDDPETDMCKLASLYVNSIKEVIPHGPYRLGGYSAGGNIAFEVARQLIESGEIVETLYCIDSVLLDANSKTNQISEDDAKDLLEYFGFNPADNRLLQLANIELQLLFNYTPKSRQHIKVVLLKAMNIFSSMDGLHDEHVARYFFQPHEKFSSWDKYAYEVHKHELEADHHSIIEFDNLQKVTSLIQNDIKSINSDENITVYCYC